MSSPQDRLFHLAKTGQTTEFITLFDQMSDNDFETIIEINEEIGCAAVDGGSIEILQHLNKFYDRPFEIFMAWLDHAVKTEKLDIALWLSKNAIGASRETVEIALGTGNLRLIQTMAESYQKESSEDVEFDILWERKIGTNIIRQVFEIFNYPEELLSAAAKAGDIAFLKEYLDDYTEEVLKPAIQYGLAPVYQTPTLTSEQQEIAFRLFLDQGKDELAVAVLEHINLPIEQQIATFISAARTGCLRVIQSLETKMEAKLVTSALITDALISGIKYDPVTAWLLERKVTWTPDQTKSVVTAASKLPTPLYNNILARPEVQYLGSLQFALLTAITSQCLTAIALLATLSHRCDFTDPQVMTLAATTRNIELIQKLSSYGGDIGITFRECVRRNDSDTVGGLLPLVPTLAQWALDHARTVNNSRMIKVLTAKLVESK